jgi:hypothetical protein
MQQPKVLTGFSHIEVLGAREHNLKNIDVSIPRNQLVDGPAGMLRGKAGDLPPTVTLPGAGCSTPLPHSGMQLTQG